MSKYASAEQTPDRKKKIISEFFLPNPFISISKAAIPAAIISLKLLMASLAKSESAYSSFKGSDFLISSKIKGSSTKIP